jgi:hypothetical protein
MAENPIDPFAPQPRDANSRPIGPPPPAEEPTSELPTVAQPTGHDGTSTPVEPEQPQTPQSIRPDTPPFSDSPIEPWIAGPPPPGPPAVHDYPPQPVEVPAVTQPSLAPGSASSAPPAGVPGEADSFERSTAVAETGRHAGRGRAGLVTAIVAAVLVVAGVVAGVIYAVNGLPGAATVADGESAGDRHPDEESASPGPSDEGSGAQSADPSDEGAADDESLAGRPGKFGAWSTGNGRYQAKWEAPADTGGSDITGYRIGDCEGNELTTVDADTFHVAVEADSLTCMSVQAVNEAGPGEEASFTIKD